MQIAIFLVCCAILGVSIVVCFELRHIRGNINFTKFRLETAIEWYGEQILDELPNTFEYNGMRGKVFKK